MDTDAKGFSKGWGQIATPPLKTTHGGLNHAFVAAEVTRLKSQHSRKTGQSLLTSAATRRWWVASSAINGRRWLSGSPSLRPSPPRRGRILRRRDALPGRHAIRPPHASENQPAATDNGAGDKPATHDCYSLSPGERARVRASVHLTSSGNARRELEKKSGRKVVTHENYLTLTQAMKKAERMK